MRCFYPPQHCEFCKWVIVNNKWNDLDLLLCAYAVWCNMLLSRDNKKYELVTWSLAEGVWGKQLPLWCDWPLQESGSDALSNPCSALCSFQELRGTLCPNYDWHMQHRRKCFCKKTKNRWRDRIRFVNTIATALMLLIFLRCCSLGHALYLEAFWSSLLLHSCPPFHAPVVPPLVSSLPRLAVRTPLSGIRCSLWNYITCFSI